MGRVCLTGCKTLGWLFVTWGVGPLGELGEVNWDVGHSGGWDMVTWIVRHWVGRVC